MNSVKKTMFVMMASLVTMSLFSFKNAGTNEASFKNASVTSYATYNGGTETEQARFTGAIIRAVKKAWQKSTRDIAWATTAITDFTGVQYSEYSASEVAVKSQTLLAKL